MKPARNCRHPLLPTIGGWRIVATLAIAPIAAAADREPVVGGPCEECVAVFVGLPESIPSLASIAPPDEPGTPLRVEGTVRDAAGAPVEGVIVYAYHTNNSGRYPHDSNTRGTPAERHGMLRGWAMSDSAGRYVFETIRPGGYPLSRIPEHIHMHVIEPGRCTYYIDDIVFEDDKRLTDTDRRRTSRTRGGMGVTKPTQHESARSLSGATSSSEKTFRATHIANRECGCHLRSRSAVLLSLF